MRGHKSGLLTSSDYNNLCQCESLEDIKLHLVRFPACQHGTRQHADVKGCIVNAMSIHNVNGPLIFGDFLLQQSTDYGPYLANVASPLHTTTIVEQCTEKLTEDWARMRCNVRLC